MEEENVIRYPKTFAAKIKDECGEYHSLFYHPDRVGGLIWYCADEDAIKERKHANQ